MDNKLDAIMFAVNEKAKEAYKIINEIENNSNNQRLDYQFQKGQFQAYSEVYTMLLNLK
jgi:hypothetical protein